MIDFNSRIEQTSEILESYTELLSEGRYFYPYRSDQMLSKINKAPLLKTSLAIRPKDEIGEFQRKIGQMILLSDLVVVHNDPIELAKNDFQYHQESRLISGGWEPVATATDVNAYISIYGIAVYHQKVMSECKKQATSGVPVIYFPTVVEYQDTVAWDEALRRERISEGEIWKEAVRRSEFSVKRRLPTLSSFSSKFDLVQKPGFVLRTRPLLQFEIPVFDNLTVFEINELSKSYPEAYGRFRVEFRKILDLARQALGSGDMKEIQRIKAEYLYDEVIRLNQEYKRIRHKYRKKLGVEVVTLLTFSALALSTQNIIQFLTTAGGLYKIRGLFLNYIDYEKELLRMQESKHWFFWKMLKEKKIPVSKLIS